MMWDKFLDDIASEFLQNRVVTEKFDPSKFKHYKYKPEVEFVKSMLTGYIVDRFYMKTTDVFKQSVVLHKLILPKDEEFHLLTTRVARNTGMKDQVLISLLMWSKYRNRDRYFDQLVELLSTFPPNQILRKFVEVKRKTLDRAIVGGFGTFEKKLLTAVFEKWKNDITTVCDTDINKFDYYLAKYRRSMRDLIRLVHYKIDPDRWKFLNNIYEYSGDNQYFSDIVRILNRKYDIESYNIPFEIVRSNIPKVDWPQIILHTDLTGNTLVMMAYSLYGVFSEMDAVKMLSDLFEDRVIPARYVDCSKILKAAIAAQRRGNPVVARMLARVYTKKVYSVYKDMILPISDPPRISMVLDGSGSMSPRMFRGEYVRVLSCISPFGPLIRKLTIFSESAFSTDPRMLSTVEGIIRLMEQAPDGGTNIYEGLRIALDEVKNGETNLVMIGTDEQHNIGRSCHEIIKEIKRYGAEVILINPTPYPIHASPDVIYVPAPTPEAVSAALKLYQLRKELQEKDAKEIILQLAK